MLAREITAKQRDNKVITRIWREKQQTDTYSSYVRTREAKIEGNLAAGSSKEKTKKGDIFWGRRLPVKKVVVI